MNKRTILRRILVEHYDLLKDANYEKCMDAIISTFGTKEITKDEINQAIDKGFDSYDGCEQLGRDVVKHHIAKAICAKIREWK